MPVAPASSFNQKSRSTGLAMLFSFRKYHAELVQPFAVLQHAASFGRYFCKIEFRRRHAAAITF